jgi:hypothetical protein
LVGGGPAQQLTAAEQPREPRHDAPEGLPGFNTIRPLKQAPGRAIRRIEARVREAVNTRHGLPRRTPDARSAHVYADRTAAASEAMHVAGWTRTEVLERFGPDLEPTKERRLVTACNHRSIHAPTPSHDMSAAVREGSTAPSIPALCEARDKPTTRGSDHGHYRRNLAVRACYGAG